MRFLVLASFVAVALAFDPRGEYTKSIALNASDTRLAFNPKVGLNLAAPRCTVRNLLPRSIVQPNVCPFVWATDLSRPRGIQIAANKVTALWDANNDGTSDSSERVVLARAPSLTHGLAIDPVNGYLYASSATQIFRWRYRAGDRRDLGAGELVIDGIPCCGHTTRTIEFSPDYTVLYTMVGSAANIDRHTLNSRVVRFPVSSFTSLPVRWAAGELVADGLRNEIALRFDPRGRLWGVENGFDNAFRADLGGSIVRDNPGEELNLFDVSRPGLHYGYPWCWSEYILAPPYGRGRNTQWTHNDFMATPPYSDAWCNNPANVVKPVFSFGAHVAPIDLVFDTSRPSSRPGFDVMAYVSFHGSWNRSPAAGYDVHRMWIRTNQDGTLDVEEEPLIKSAGPGETVPGWIRPTGMGMIPCPFISRTDCLMVASDQTNDIIGLALDFSN